VEMGMVSMVDWKRVNAATSVWETVPNYAVGQMSTQYGK
jgi:hypothetical protein